MKQKCEACGSDLFRVDFDGLRTVIECRRCQGNQKSKRSPQKTRSVSEG